MLSHCRPPGHNRKLQSESRDNGHISFGTLSPLRYLFIRTLLPSDLWISYRLAYILSFALLAAPIRYAGPGSTTPTPAPLR